MPSHIPKDHTMRAMEIPDAAPLQKLKNDMKVNKTSMRGKEIQLIGHAIALCEQLVNAVKRAWQDAKVHYHYGVNRKAVKKEVNALLQEHTQIANTCDKIRRECSKSPESESGQRTQAKKIIQLNQTLENQLTAFAQGYDKTTYVTRMLQEAPLPSTALSDLHNAIQANIQLEKQFIENAKNNSADESKGVPLKSDAHAENRENFTANQPSTEVQQEAVTEVKFSVAPALQPGQAELLPIATRKAPISPKTPLERDEKYLLNALNGIALACSQEKSTKGLVRQALKLLAKHPAFATDPLPDGSWALHSAVKYGPQELVDKLLELGAGPPAFEAAARLESDALASKIFLVEDETLVPKLFEAIMTREGALLRKTNPQATVEEQIKKIHETHQPAYKDAKEENPLLAAISANDTAAFIQQILDGADFKVLNEQKQSLLHLAAIHQNKLAAWTLRLFGLDPDAPDKSGQNFWNYAQKNEWNEFFADSPRALAQRQLDCEMAENMVAKQLLSRTKTASLRQSCRTGLPEHNPLLIKAIQTADVKTFVRLAMDGADLRTWDNHDQSLLHLAAVHQNKPLARFLLSQGLDPAMADKQGNTFNQLAETNGWKEFLQTSPDTEPDTELVKQLKTIDEALDKIKQDYETERQGYTAEFRQLKQDQALHASTGHNNLLMNYLHEGNLSAFICAVEMGASVDTLDHQGYSLLHHAVAADNLEILEYLLLKYRENDPATEKKLHPNLNPFRLNQAIENAPSLVDSYKLFLAANDFKSHQASFTYAWNALNRQQVFEETPLAIAIRKKNLPAVYLILNEGNTTQTVNLNTKHKQLHEALHSWKQLIQRCDPLNLTVKDNSRLFSAGCWLFLSQACTASGFNSLGSLMLCMQVASVAEQCFQYYYAQDALAEELVNPAPVYSLPEPLQKISRPVSQFAFAEMLTGPAVCLATTTSVGLRTISDLQTSFHTLKKIAGETRARPLTTAKKAFVSLAPTGLTMHRFYNTLWSSLKSVAALTWSEKSLKFPEQPLETLTKFPSEQALREDPEYAEKVLKYFSAREHVRTGHISELRLKAAPIEEPLFDTAEKIRKAYRQSSLLAHPDKGGSQELSTLVNSAKKVLLERHTASTASADSSIQIPGYAILSLKTIVNVGLVWGMNCAPIQANAQLRTIGMALMALYVTGRLSYDIGSWAYNAFESGDGASSNS